MKIGYELALEARELEAKYNITKKECAQMLKEKYGLHQQVSTIERKLRYINSIITPEIDDLPDYTPNIPSDITIDFRPVMVLADIHAPNFNRNALREALIMARSRHISTAIILGDFLDNAWCSHFIDLAKETGMYAVSNQIDLVYRTLKAITSSFEYVYIIRGNHDERLTKKLENSLSMSEIYKIFSIQKGDENLYDKLEIVERFHMYMVDSPTGDWMFAHQKNISAIRGKVAQDLATRYEINVVTSHVHDLGITTSRNKHRYWAVAPGCLADVNKMAYKQMRVSTASPWITGWAIINEEGIPEVFHYAKEFSK